MMKPIIDHPTMPTLIPAMKKHARRLLTAVSPIMLLTGISGYFMEPWHLRLPVSIVAGMLMAFCLQAWLENRQREAERDQHKGLLEYLLARMSSGTTLENAFGDAPNHLHSLFGRRSPFIDQLFILSQQIRSGSSLAQPLLKLSDHTDCLQARVFFCSLASLQGTGASLIRFVRLHLNMSLETKQLLQSVKAEQAQRRTEATLLCGMPFLVAFLFPSAEAKGDFTFAQGMMFIAFLLAVTALFLTCRYLVESPSKALRLPLQIRSRPRLELKRPSEFLRTHYFQLFPAGYTLRLQDALATIDLLAVQEKSKEGMRHAFFRQKLLLILLSLPLGMLFWLLGPKMLAPLLPILFCLAHDQKMMRFAAQFREVCQSEYPVFIRVLAALLQVDLSPHHALRLANDVFLQPNRTAPLFQPLFLRELHRLRKRLNMAWSAGMILQELADHCPVPEGRSAFTLMAQYESLGSSHLLHLIDMQATACWLQQKNALRAQKERQSLKLLLPMVFNLIAVMIISLAPAVTSLIHF